MANFQIHNADNPSGFFCNGTEDEARAYVGYLNRGRVLNMWTLRPLPGSRPRGLKLSKLIADHAAAHNANIAETRRILAHGHRGTS
jgi:hypothetical protein